MSVTGLLNPSRFIITFDELECQEVNAEDVTSYIVQYGLPGSTMSQTESPSRPFSPFTITDSSLLSLVNYQFQVAAVNSKAMGSFSEPVLGFILGG